MIRFLSCVLLGALVASAQPPSVAPGGVLNAASFAKDTNGLGSPVAPGSLVAIFGSFSGASLATADTIPLSTDLGNVQITFNNIPAPLQAVSPAGAFPFVTAQVPYEVIPAGQTSVTANVVVTVKGVSSAPEQTTIKAVAPGVFTIPPDGQSNAVLVFVDSDGIAKIAAPASASASIGYPTAPIHRGASGFFYATGLGAKTPPVADGDGASTGPPHFANSTPVVLIGGITAQVQFAGQAPGFPGVDQINIVIPQNAPTGNAVPLQIMTADGSITTTPKATIAIQ
ncbi:MAG TPA: hypothetical protein VKX39_16355 [Bryobacteraceae bacterium]|jgi:uncharacterized protein (TIGR03437 family)|nr:hypothetical protein [Bryobacteraceae bacterium]